MLTSTKKRPASASSNKKVKRSKPQSYCNSCHVQYSPNDNQSAKNLCPGCQATCFSCRVKKEDEVMPLDRWQHPICAACNATCQKCGVTGQTHGDLQRGILYDRTCVQCRENEQTRTTLASIFARGLALPYHPTRADITAHLQELEAVLAPLRASYLK